VLPTASFRVARPAPAACNLAKTAGQMAVVWTLALLVLPTMARRLDVVLGLTPLDAIAAPLGAAVLAAASGLGIWSAWVMATIGQGTPIPLDAARELVVVGPYRWVRNPMAISGIGQALGLALWSRSPSTLLIPIAGVVVWTVLLRPPEERFLAERFGAAYLAYQRDVRCWVPRRPCSSRGRDVSWMVQPATREVGGCTN
jgi:protein-S-isoprenylcysteine O-methyltransferase Ste14